jgi:Flp pilus assembly protein TadD
MRNHEIPAGSAFAGLSLLAAFALLAAGCASTGVSSTKATGKPVESSAQISVEQDVGFTITEEVKASGDVRLGYEEALALLEQDELDRGIAVLERIAGEAPGLTAPRIDLGIATHRAGDLESAEAWLDEALALSPDHPIVHNELGIIYRKTGRFAAARQSYERALAVFPGYHYARRNLAVLCDLYLRDLQCALDNYEAYMTTVPEDGEASIWIADIRMRMGIQE